MAVVLDGQTQARAQMGVKYVPGISQLVFQRYQTLFSSVVTKWFTSIYEQWQHVDWMLASLFNHVNFYEYNDILCYFS